MAESSLDHTIDTLYDPLIALQRLLVDAEREYRSLAENDRLAVDTLGVETSPGECVAETVEALADIRALLRTAETRWSDAKRNAGRLYIDR